MSYTHLIHPISSDIDALGLPKGTTIELEELLASLRDTSAAAAAAAPAPAPAPPNPYLVSATFSVAVWCMWRLVGCPFGDRGDFVRVRACVGLCVCVCVHPSVRARG
jgi:hypothetical protein